MDPKNLRTAPSGRDPLADAIRQASFEGTLQALEQASPRLTRTRAETAAMTGTSIPTVDRMIADGRLRTLVGGRVLLSSIYELVGWPLTPAPVVAPMSSIPCGELT